MWKFCSKGTFKLEMTGSGVIEMEDAPRFFQEPEPRGCLGKQQSAQQAWQHWQEIIYLSFIPSVLPSLLLLHFINFHSCSLICFPFTGDLVQGGIPSPSHEQQEHKICVLGPWCRLTHPLGSQIRVFAHYRENQAQSLQFYQTFYPTPAPDLSGLDFIDRSFNTNSEPNGSIHIWKEDLGKKQEQSKR